MSRQRTTGRKTALRWAAALLGVSLMSGSAHGAPPTALAVAERFPGQQVTARLEQGTIRFLSGDLGDGAGPPAEVARGFLTRHRGLFGLTSAQRQLGTARVFPTPAGTMVRFEQVEGGLPLLGGGMTVRIGAGRILSVSNRLAAAGGRRTSGEDVGRSAAIDSARRHLALDVLPEAVSRKALSWDGRVHEVYEVAFPFVGGAHPSRYVAYVDRGDGRLVLLDNRVRHEMLPASGVGPGLDGQSRTVPTSYAQERGRYLLANRVASGVAVRTYTMDGSGDDDALPGQLISDHDNYWTDAAALDAHVYGNQVFDFFETNYGDMGWFADSGFQEFRGLVSSVHYETRYDNAFWDGRQMVYGDGGEVFYPLSGSIDVVAHEIQHGVSSAVNGLVYCMEPGALDESWSDVFSMFVQIDTGDPDPYLLAEDIMKVGKRPRYEYLYALRRMDDPAFRSDAYPDNDYQRSDPMGSHGDPEHTREQFDVEECLDENDYGGVHINSGIPNKAAYLVTTTVGAGKAKQIYYQAMFYLTATASFRDARDAVEQATIDLYGTGPELQAVGAAFDAVGIR